MHTPAAAEEGFDFRTDTLAFCGKIAELNYEISNAVRTNDPNSAFPAMVLFLTREVPLDFEAADFEPLSVVYGPRGFSALTCTDPMAAVAWLQQQECVVHAEIDSEVKSCSDGDEDMSISFQSWAAQSAGFGEYNHFAKQWGTGSCTVAVIDSGVYRHSLINPKILSLGHDYIDNDDDPTNDLHGHGTRVAGIVADCTRELPVYIFPIRVLDADASGRTSNVISAVLEATDAHVSVINLSLSTFTESEMLETAIRNAISSGIIVVAAAGNYACDASEVTPACMMDAGIIVVGSAETDGSRSSFSNYGASVDLYFYGRNIVSCSRSGGYVSDTGTSMAAPHISAMCAMIRIVHTSISAGNIVSRIQHSYGDGIAVPNAANMVPKSLGFHLETVSIRKGKTLPLPAGAYPDTSQEAIGYSVSDPSVADVRDGVLETYREGETEIVASCMGFDDLVIHIAVLEGETAELTLPSDLLSIEDEAFLGIRADHVAIPQGVLSIGDRAFGDGRLWFITVPDSVTAIGSNDFSNAVIWCKRDSLAYEYALEHQLQYIICE